MDQDQFVTAMAFLAAQGRVAALATKDRTQYYTQLIAEWKAAYADFGTLPWDETFPALGKQPGKDTGATTPTSGGPIGTP